MGEVGELEVDPVAEAMAVTWSRMLWVAGEEEEDVDWGREPWLAPGVPLEAEPATAIWSRMFWLGEEEEDVGCGKEAWLPPGALLETWEGVGWVSEGLRGLEAAPEREAIVARAPAMASLTALMASSEAEGGAKRDEVEEGGYREDGNGREGEEEVSGREGEEDVSGREGAEEVSGAG